MRLAHTGCYTYPGLPTVDVLQAEERYEQGLLDAAACSSPTEELAFLKVQEIRKKQRKEQQEEEARKSKEEYHSKKSERHCSGWLLRTHVNFASLEAQGVPEKEQETIARALGFPRLPAPWNEMRRWDHTMSQFLQKGRDSHYVLPLLRVLRYAKPEDYARHLLAYAATRAARALSKLILEEEGVIFHDVLWDMMLWTEWISPPGKEAHANAEKALRLNDTISHREEIKPTMDLIAETVKLFYEPSPSLFLCSEAAWALAQAYTHFEEERLEKRTGNYATVSLSFLVPPSTYDPHFIEEPFEHFRWPPKKDLFR